MVQLSEVILMKLLNLHPIIGLQKEEVRIITFSQYHEHISPIFEDLNIMKFLDAMGNLLPRGINDFMRLAMLVNFLLTRISLHTGL